MSPAMSKIYGLILQQIPDIPDKEWTLGPDDHFFTAVPFLGLPFRMAIVLPSLEFLGFLELPRFPSDRIGMCMVSVDFRPITREYA